MDSKENVSLKTAIDAIRQRWGSDAVRKLDRVPTRAPVDPVEPPPAPPPSEQLPEPEPAPAVAAVVAEAPADPAPAPEAPVAEPPAEETATVRCPNCGKIDRLPRRVIGKRGQCQDCAHVFELEEFQL